MRIIETEPRNCDICLSSNLQEIWTYKSNYRTKTDISTWNVRNVVCKKCGFAFVSPVPLQKCLEEHYGDSFELSSGLKPDFSVEKRMRLIKKYCSGEKTSYLEIGSNHCPEFESELQKTVETISTMEINQSCQSSFKNTDEIPEKTADIITAYFVLEHIPSPLKMLANCARVLKKSGVLIVEVPNLYLYPDDPAGLLLCEHVNHFSPTTLTAAGKLCGLELVEFSGSSCSRPFGFVAVFKKVAAIRKKAQSNQTEYAIARASMTSGVERLEKLDTKIEEAKERILASSNKGKKSLIWSANWICLKLLERLGEVPETALFIDSDPRKANYLSNQSVNIPLNVKKEIAEAEYLVLNSALYADEIKNWIKTNTGKIFDNSNSTIMDYF